MTKVTVDGDHISVKGHAMFDYHGKDIVCAAISSIVITSVNGVLAVDDDALEFKQGSGFIDIRIKKHDKVTDALIRNMIDLLKELETQYKKNIKVEEVHYD